MLSSVTTVWLVSERTIPYQTSHSTFSPTNIFVPTKQTVETLYPALSFSLFATGSLLMSFVLVG